MIKNDIKVNRLQQLSKLKLKDNKNYVDSQNFVMVTKTGIKGVIVFFFET